MTKQDCRQVSYMDCQPAPQQQCRTVHKKVPKRVSKQVRNANKNIYCYNTSCRIRVKHNFALQVQKQVCSEGNSGAFVEKGVDSGFNTAEPQLAGNTGYNSNIKAAGSGAGAVRSDAPGRQTAGGSDAVNFGR